MDLRNRERVLYENAKLLKNDVLELRNNAVELLEAEVIEENIFLRNEVAALRAKLEENKPPARGHGSCVTGKMLLLFLFGLFCVMCLISIRSNKNNCRINYALP
ncbi:hypothetical protein COLO4_10222 [Corchorus olitorius]|uniref:Uncharacterized protein n=1 Tax=Corchorus olitorius TaxID=93759 RepID=A0A1R3K9I5_9ROSI|nr:hypothetical protein COLO4_10222 [Corchorus olitorius]